MKSPRHRKRDQFILYSTAFQGSLSHSQVDASIEIQHNLHQSSQLRGEASVVSLKAIAEPFQDQSLRILQQLLPGVLRTGSGCWEGDTAQPTAIKSLTTAFSAGTSQ